MIRRLLLAGVTALTIQAQVGPGISFCPSPLHPEGVLRVLTVKGAGFNTTTTATWQQAGTQTPLTVQFVSATAIRLVIPAMIGTVAGTTGTIAVSTGNTTLTAAFTFNTTFSFIVCEVQPAEFTAQPNPVTFTVYGDQLSFTTFRAGGITVPLVPQFGATVATATVPGTWVAGPLTVAIDGASPNVAFQTNVLLTVNPVPAITGAAPSRLYAGQSVRETLSVNGGTPGPNGFQWSAPNAPPWISIQPAGARTATLVVEPPATTVSATVSPQIVVTDGLPAQAVSSTPVSVPVVVDALPDLTITALPDDNKIQPDQQYMIRVGTARATPLRLTGQMNLGTSTAAFISGTNAVNSVAFDIPPNCVLTDPCTPVYPLQAGTVSGAVALTGTVTPGPPPGASAPPAVVFPARNLQQDAAPPHIDANRISVRQTAGGFDVCVPGFSNTRQMNDVTFRFVAAAGKSISAFQGSRTVDGDFASWFTPQNAAAQGGFTLVQSFNLQGSIGAVGQFFVILRNSAGASQEVGPIDLAAAPRCTAP